MQLAIRDESPAIGISTRILRALGVTLGLGVAGTSLGAILGGGLFAALSVVINNSGCVQISPGYAFLAGGTLGGGFGGIALPLAAWTLPRVAIGRIVAATALGAIAGGTAGFVLTNPDFSAVVLGSLIGFGLATSLVGFRSAASANSTATSTEEGR